MLDPVGIDRRDRLRAGGDVRFQERQEGAQRRVGLLGPLFDYDRAIGQAAEHDMVAAPQRQHFANGCRHGRLTALRDGGGYLEDLGGAGHGFP